MLLMMAWLWLTYHGGQPSLFVVVASAAEALAEAYFVLEWLTDEPDMEPPSQGVTYPLDNASLVANLTTYIYLRFQLFDSITPDEDNVALPLLLDARRNELEQILEIISQDTAYILQQGRDNHA